MTRPPAGHDRQREQIEGDHGYRDEPPQHAPPARIMTSYTITESTGNEYRTTDAEIAEAYSEAGLRVTVETWVVRR